MLSTLAVVEAPAVSSRQNLSVLRRLGGKPLLEWVVRRVSDSQRVDGCVALIDAAQANSLWRMIPADVPVFTHHRSDALGTYAALVREYPTRAVVRVRVETPFVDPVLIDRLITCAAAHPECDYISFSSADGSSPVRSQVGLFAEWVKADALKRADRKASDPNDRKDPLRFICARPDLFQLRYLPAPAEVDQADMRLALEVDADWDHCEAIYEALGPDGLDWQRIAGLLRHQPALRERMALLNRGEAVVGIS